VEYAGTAVQKSYQKTTESADVASMRAAARS
jgi:hypothetical protein